MRSARGNTALCRRIALLTGALFICLPVCGQPTPVGLDILVLSSYHDGYAWSDSEITAIRDAFHKSGVQPRLHVQHLDLKRNPALRSNPALLSLLEDKLRQRRFALALVLDDPALDLVRQHRDRLLPDVPIVFCGIESTPLSTLLQEPGMTGVLENLDYALTLQFIRDLQPTVRTVYVFLDETPGQQTAIDRLREAVNRLGNPFDLEFLINVSITETLTRIGQIPAGEAILNCGLLADPGGEFLGDDQSFQEAFSTGSPVPIYYVAEHVFREQIHPQGAAIGGVLASATVQGGLAARMALRILSGTPADTLPIETQPSPQRIVDYRALQRFHLPLKQLPPDTLLLNREPSVWTDYREWAVSLVALASGLAALAAILALHLIQKRRAEARVRQIEELYREAIRSADAVPYRNDFVKNSFSFIDDDIERLTGYSSAEMNPELWAEITEHQILRGKQAGLPLEEAVRRTRAGEFSQWKSECRVRRRDGAFRWIMDCSVEIPDADGQHRAAVGMLIDITEHRQAEVRVAESERFLKRLIATSPLLIYVYDLSLERVVFSNRRFSELLGFSGERADLVDRTMGLAGCAAGDEDQHTHLVSRWQRLGDEQVIASEYRVRDAGGRWRWIYSTNALFQRGAKGEVQQIIGTARDVTERVEAHTALAERTNLLTLEAAVSATLGREDATDNTLRECIRTISQHLPESLVALWLTQSPPGQLKLAASEQFLTRPSRLAAAETAAAAQIVLRERRELHDSPIRSGAPWDPEGLLAREGFELLSAYPLLPGDRLLGVMVVLGRHNLAKVTLEALTPIADRLGLSLLRHLNQQAESALLRRTQHAANAITRLAVHPGMVEGTWDSLSLEVLKAANEVLNVDDARLWILDEHRSELVCTGPQTPDNPLPEEPTPHKRTANSAEQLLGRLKEERVVQLRFAQAPADGMDWLFPGASPRATGDVLVAGIRLAGSIEGLLCCWHSGARSWHADEISFLGTMADQTAQALLHQRRQKAEKRVRELNAELEQRVEARTRELRTRVEEAEQLNAGMINLLEDLRETQAEAETAARRLEESNEQLKSLNQELEAFSYSVSHDLRAPLRNISGFITLLGRELGAELGNGPARYMKIIGEEANRMGGLIDDLLKLSRITQAEMTTQRIDPERIVAAVRKELLGAISDRNIEWTIARLPAIQGDPNLVRLIFQNLIGNAVKFTAGRDPAQIEVGTDPSTADEGEVAFYVRDNGTGFNMKYAHKLFGVFQRLHSSKQFEGSGIGLANAQRIVHRHRGRIWAEGVEGKGATFFFSLPKA